MANVKFYSGGGSRPLGGQIDEIPYITAKPGQINTIASTRLRFTEKMVKALMDKREADMKRDDRAQYMAAATTKGFDPSKMAPMEEESPYVAAQRDTMAQALAGTPQSQLGGSADNVFLPPTTEQPSQLGLSVDDVFSPAALTAGPQEDGDGEPVSIEELIEQQNQAGQRALFGADPASNPAMQAALIGDVGTRAEDEADYLAKQKAAHIGPREAMRNLTPRTEYGKNLQSEYELGEMERDRALQEAEVERQREAALLLEASKEARLLKAIGPPKAGEKPGTPYEVNGRLVQDHQDDNGDWRRRDLGAASNGGPFDGTGMEPQLLNILLTGDPSSPEYLAAFTRTSEPKIIYDPATGATTLVNPNMSPYRLPTGTQSGEPGNGYGSRGGVEERSPTKVSPQIRNEIDTTITNSASLINALIDYRDTFTSAGTGQGIKSLAGLSTPETSAWTNAGVMAKGRELYDLGVLAGQDLDLLKKAFPDPSTVIGQLASDEDVRDSVDKVINIIQDKITAKQQRHNLPVTDIRLFSAELRKIRAGQGTQRAAQTNKIIIDGLVGEDKEAYDWALAHRSTPQATKILEGLGIK